MSQILSRIKQAVREGRFDFSAKARLEMQVDDLEEIDVIESIANASVVYKSLRSTSGWRVAKREYLHVIISPNSSGLMIYTKGKLASYAGIETYYFFVSSKRSD